MKKELHNIFNNVNEWLKFAEAKNAGILGLTSIMVFWLLRLVNSNIDGFCFYFYYGLILVGAIVIILALMSFAPILNKFYSNNIGKYGNHKNIYFYGDIKDFKDKNGNFKTDEYLLLVHKKAGKNVNNFTPNPLEEDLAKQIIVNSHIAYRKYSIFKLIINIYLYGSITALIGALAINYLY